MRMSKRKKWAALAFVFLHFLSACSVNVLDGTAGKTTDEAYFEDALKQIDDQDYSSALSNFSKLSQSFAARTDVLEAWAGAYAGHCGLDFAAYMNTMSTTDFGTDSFFTILMRVWGGKAVVPASCKAAEEKIKAIWEIETPTASQQLFMVILSMVKIGTYLRVRADRENGGIGDGTKDATFSACASSTADDHLSDDEVKELITGFSLFLQNITGFAGTVTDTLDVNTIKVACSQASVDVCATSEAENVTPQMVAAMRDVLELPIIGMGSCIPIPSVDDCCP